MRPGNFLLIPDSFKGTMSSAQICEIMSGVIHSYFPEAQVSSIPVADGGEGSVDAFLQALGGEKVDIEVHGPYMEKMKCCYGIVNGDTAVIEMASCAGLPLVEGKLNPSLTTTFGVGEQMLDAARRGCKKIIVGLGGSCTTDLGCGAAAACGVEFFDASGKTFVPVGGTMKDVSRIDVSKLNSAIKNKNIITMCDVDNPLYGPTGAAFVFGPQKGADEAMVKSLDQGLEKLGGVVLESLGVDIRFVPGSGAAGGMGAGMIAFFGSQLQMGIETVLDTVGFDQKALDADFVFTGEGKIDSQSLRGKVVIGVARRVKAGGSKAKVIAFVGDIGPNIENCYEEGVCSILSTNRVAVPFSQSKLRAKDDLRLTVDNFIRLLAAF